MVQTRTANTSAPRGRTRAQARAQQRKQDSESEDINRAQSSSEHIDRAQSKRGHTDRVQQAPRRPSPTLSVTANDRPGTPLADDQRGLQGEGQRMDSPSSAPLAMPQDPSASPLTACQRDLEHRVYHSCEAMQQSFLRYCSAYVDRNGRLPLSAIRESLHGTVATRLNANVSEDIRDTRVVQAFSVMRRQFNVHLLDLASVLGFDFVHSRRFVLALHKEVKSGCWDTDELILETRAARDRRYIVQGYRRNSWECKDVETATETLENRGKRKHPDHKDGDYGEAGEGDDSSVSSIEIGRGRRYLRVSATPADDSTDFLDTNDTNVEDTFEELTRSSAAYRRRQSTIDRESDKCVPLHPSSPDDASVTSANDNNCAAADVPLTPSQTKLSDQDRPAYRSADLQMDIPSGDVSQQSNSMPRIDKQTSERGSRSADFQMDIPSGDVSQQSNSTPSIDKQTSEEENIHCYAYTSFHEQCITTAQPIRVDSSTSQTDRPTSENPAPMTVFQARHSAQQHTPSLHPAINSTLPPDPVWADAPRLRHMQDSEDSTLHPALGAVGHLRSHANSPSTCMHSGPEIPQTPERALASLEPDKWVTGFAVRSILDMFAPQKYHVVDSGVVRLRPTGEAQTRRYMHKIFAAQIPLLAIPICCNMHWSGCMLDLEKRQCLLYDPIRSTGSYSVACLDAIKEFVQSLPGQHDPSAIEYVFATDGIIQRDLYNCGILVMFDIMLRMAVHRIPKDIDLSLLRHLFSLALVELFPLDLPKLPPFHIGDILRLPRSQPPLRSQNPSQAYTKGFDLGSRMLAAEADMECLHRQTQTCDPFLAVTSMLLDREYDEVPWARYTAKERDVAAATATALRGFRCEVERLVERLSEMQAQKNQEIQALEAEIHVLISGKCTL